MRPKGTSIQLEVRRRVAVFLLEAGWGVHHVPDISGPPPVPLGAGAMLWCNMPGRDSTPNLILVGVKGRAHGLCNELWTLSRIAIVFERHFGVTYCPANVWHLLRRLKWSTQKPQRRARERDE